jgi:hypothetical protein
MKWWFTGSKRKEATVGGGFGAKQAPIVAPAAKASEPVPVACPAMVSPFLRACYFVSGVMCAVILLLLGWSLLTRTLGHPLFWLTLLLGAFGIFGACGLRIVDLRAHGS